MRRIYLDHAATSPLLPEAREAMLDCLVRFSANPSSTHLEGQRSKRLIDEAREHVADALGCLFGEICFTSGGTEAANLAIVGSALAAQASGRRRVVWSPSEHHCVLHTRPILEALGFEVAVVPTDRQARIDLGALAEAIDDQTCLVAAMHANNELGTIQDVRAIAELAHAAGALCFVDAVQTFLALDWSAASLGADLLSVSAHKIGGPMGVGALFVRSGTSLQPLIAGGAQERERRGGTENACGIVGFGAAVRVGKAKRPESFVAKRAARDAFLEHLHALAPNAFRVSADLIGPVLPGHAHLRFPGIRSETLLVALDRAGVACSAGAACSSGSLEPSHVLLACGYSPSEANEGVRFTFGDSTTVEDAQEAAVRVAETLGRIGSARSVKP